MFPAQRLCRGGVTDGCKHPFVGAHSLPQLKDISTSRLNRATGWFRTGELVFWDAILLIAVFLVWLRWF